jgi:Tol biopolymer transport system component
MSGEPALLVENENYFMQPVWAPDGSWIALSGVNYNELWVVKSDGSSLKRLSDEAGSGFGIEWSADSKEILTAVTKYEGAFRKNAIKIFNPEQSSERFLTEYAKHVSTIPLWTADNSQVYFYNGNNLEFFDTGKRLKIELYRPLYFVKRGKLFTQISASDLINSAEAVIDEQCLNIRISPDGQKIAYEILGGNLFVINADGSGEKDLGRGYRARWAPDSEHLVYMVTEDDGYEFVSSEIYIIRIDGSEKIQVTRSENQIEMNPCWSPDGNQIVYNEDKSGAIYLITLQR